MRPNSLVTRRRFFQTVSAASTINLAPLLHGGGSTDQVALPLAFSALKPLGDRVHPIPPDEFGQRIDHAHRLMVGAPPAPSGSPPQPENYHPLFLAPATSLSSSPRIPWGLRDRP